MAKSINTFRAKVWRYYRTHGRHALPWRKTKDPYKILVSEVMLQQTQVERVNSFYKNFLKQFPTPRALAEASLGDVLRAWQGLGYNRRARTLQSAAKSLMGRSGFPKNSAEWKELPGVGRYTARAVATFAWNQDVILIETNIRTAVIHHFFPKKKKVSDTEIEKILMQALPKGKAREWYSALMDYGAHLKRSGISHNARSKTYTKQSVFKGSLREARGAILRALAEKPQALTSLTSILGTSRKPQLKQALSALIKEGLIEKRRAAYVLSGSR